MSDDTTPATPAPGWTVPQLPSPKPSSKEGSRWFFEKKLPSAGLRSLPGQHEHAGMLAKLHDVPWWACWGYAASVCGSTDAKEIWEVGQQWLQGWCGQYALDIGGGKVPKELEWIVGARVDQVPM